MEAQDIIKKLNLKVHPTEGGYYIETYRSKDIINENNLPNRYNKDKSICTAIYFFLTPDTFSEIHKIPTDEIFHFYAGDTVEMLQLDPNGEGKIIKIGNNINEDEQPQVIVPANCWQGSRLIKGGKYALMGTTVSPGFDFEDYKTANKEELIRKYPDFKEIIEFLTRK